MIRKAIRMILTVRLSRLFAVTASLQNPRIVMTAIRCLAMVVQTHVCLNQGTIARAELANWKKAVKIAAMVSLIQTKFVMTATPFRVTDVWPTAWAYNKVGHVLQTAALVNKLKIRSIPQSMNPLKTFAVTAQRPRKSNVTTAIHSPGTAAQRLAS
jgi:hypothetical protein